MKKLKLVHKIIIIFIISFFMLFLINRSHLAKDSNYIFVDQGVTLLDVCEKLDYFDDILFYDSNNNLIDDYYTIVKTGIMVSCSGQDDTSYQYKLVVKGDVNGDGNIDHNDIYSIKCSIVGILPLENEFLEACDNNVDKIISLYDLFHTNQSIKNQSTSEEETDIAISKIELNETSLNLNIGESATLTHSITPENATDTEVNYFSMDSDIVEVNDEGEVTPLNNGFAQILVTCATGARATCDVTVHTIPQKLELDKKELELFINGESTYSLQPSFSPSTSNAMTNLSWNSSDADIVSVDENGKLIAKKNGTVVVTATSENNLQASCKITVYTMPSKLTIASNISIEKDLSTKIEPTIGPETSNYNTDITWRNYNKNIISISEDGTITGLEDGTATIRAYTKNGIMAECTVYVYTRIKDIILSADSTTMDLSKNNTYRIFANSETGKDITNLLSWKSEDSNIATVDESGKITAIANGTTTITASLNEELKKTFTLTVQTSPKTLTLNKDRTSLILGENEQLNYTINPNTSNIYHNVTWSSSNANVVSVTDTGLLQATGVGKAIITAQCENNIYATCFITVTKNPNKIEFDKKSMLIEKGSTNKVLLTFDTNLSEIDMDTLSIENEDNNILSYTYTTHNDKQIEFSITGLQNGCSHITASIGEVSSSCEIIVYTELQFLELYVKDTLVNNTSTSLDLSTNSSIFSINAKLNEEKFDISQIVEWNSSNSQVVSISNAGEAIIHSIGSTVISAKLNDALSSSFTIIVEASPKSIDIPNSMNLYVNGTSTFSLKPTIMPANTTIQNKVTYSSSNSKVATVDTNGTVTAHASGSATITATTENGKSDSCTVTVRTTPAQITFDTNTKYLKQGASMNLKANISPANADVQNRVSWTSSNANIVSVDNAGNLLARQPGTVTITAKTENNKSATIQIIVPNLSMKINHSTLDLTTLPTTNIVNQNSQNIGKLSYASSNNKIATVDSNGKVTGVSNGNTTIIVTESNTNTQTSIPVTVKTSTRSLSLNATAASLDIVNTTFQLSATHSPATVTSKAITWSSSNTKVATVNNGKITRVGSGTATITAKANDGSNKTASCTVTVKQEKMIICGASTVVQLAGRRTCSTKTGVYSNINFYSTYGYTVRSTNDWDKKYYSSFKAHTGKNDKDADLFFVCQGGTGYKWLTGKKPKSYYTDTGEAGEGREKIDRIIKSNPNCHFTIAFMHGGNDLKGPRSKEEVNEVAKTYANYYKSLAKTYSTHNFYIFPPTPVDVNSATDSKKKEGYNTSFSNNTKRNRFSITLNTELKNSRNNLKYCTSFYNNIQNSKEYKCYDGNHYQRSTAKFVLKTILDNCHVLTSNKKK